MKQEKISQNNATLKAHNTGKYINFKIDVGNLKDVSIRLVTPNRKLAYALYMAIKGGAKNGK